MKYTLSFLLDWFLITASAQNYIDIGRFSYANTPLKTFENTFEQQKLRNLDCN